MPGGRLNPFSVTNIVEAVNKAKEKAHARTSSLTKKMDELGLTIPYVDLSIQVNRIRVVECIRGGILVCLKSNLIYPF